MSIFGIEVKPELRKLTAVFSNFFCIPLDMWRFNFWQPIKGVTDYLATLLFRIKHFCSETDAQIMTEIVALDACMYACKSRESFNPTSDNYPTLQDTANILSASKLGPYDRRKRGNESALARSRWFQASLGQILECSRGIDIAEVDARGLNVSIEMSPGLPAQIRTTLTSVLLGDIALSREIRRRNGEELDPLTVVLDEFDQFKTNSSNEDRAHFYEDLLRLGRASGIHFVIVVHDSSKLALPRSLLANSQIFTIIGGVGDATAYEFADSMGASPEQKLWMLAHKQKGQAIISDWRLDHPFRALLANPQALRNVTVSDQEVRKRARQFVDQFDIVPPLHPAWRRHMGVPYDWKPEPKPPAVQENHETPPPPPQQADISTPSVLLSDTAMSVLSGQAERIERAVAGLSDPRQLLKGMQPLFNDLGIAKGRRTTTVLKELEAAQMGTRRNIQAGSTPSVFLEVTPRGWALLQRTRPDLPGKGSWWHSYQCFVVAYALKSRGFSNIQVEGRVQDRPGAYKYADVVWRNEADQLCGAEISHSTNVRQERANIVQDLLGSSPLSVVTVLTTTSDKRDRLAAAFAKDAELKSLVEQGRLALELLWRFIS